LGTFDGLVSADEAVQKCAVATLACVDEWSRASGVAFAAIYVAGPQAVFSRAGADAARAAGTDVGVKDGLLWAVARQRPVEHNLAGGVSRAGGGDRGSILTRPIAIGRRGGPGRSAVIQ